MKRSITILSVLMSMLMVLCVIAACTPAVESIEITTEPTKVVYSTEDTAIDYSGGVLTVTYVDGTTKDIPLTDASITKTDADVNFSRKEDQIITISYGGFEADLYISIADPTRAVTFDLNGATGTAPTTQNVVLGGKATAPTVPVRSGYVFGGWYKEATCTNAFDFAIDTVTANITLYAKWTTGFVVTFDYNYTGAPQSLTQNVVQNGNATRPADPTREGYAFGGWYTEAACTTRFNFATPITVATTLYAQWTAALEVSFNLGYENATAIPAQNVISGELATEPDDPVRDGYVFDGWFTEAAFTNEFDFDNEITAATVLYAKWLERFDVTFNLGYTLAPDASTIPAQSIPDGSKASAVTVPTREGYDFDGWYTDSDFENEFDFDDAITADTVLYAKWVLHQENATYYTVTFNLGYASAVNPTAQVVENGRVTRPVDPVREGYRFVGWFNSSECTTGFLFTLTRINADTTVYAKWVQQVTVSFNLNYTGAPASPDTQTIDVDTLAEAPRRPQRSGYTFGGWFTESALTNEFDFDVEVTASVQLYAKWNQLQEGYVLVTFDYNYTNSPDAAEQEVEIGQAALRPADPTRANETEKGHQSINFSFGGWYADSACTTAFDFTSAISENTTVYAKWTGTFIFEAEHVNLTGLRGAGYSGSADEGDMVDGADDTNSCGASNGYYLTYLYTNNLSIYFNIVSDREVSDATIVFRITAENSSILLTPDRYSIVVNPGTSNESVILYDDIAIVDVPAIGSTLKPFQDYEIAVNVHLVEGNNVIRCTATNDISMGGTMAATAPVIDCFKITTSAELSWTPVLANENQ